MYAAAGGASLASRQARQKQRQNKQKQQKQNKATDLLTKPPQAKHFQNYTDSAVPRLSRVERGALKPPITQNERRHSTSNYHLKEPHQRARIRESPSISIPVVQHNQIPQPLTPGTLVQQNHLPLHSTPSLQSQLPQIFIPEGEGKLERRCSFVRQVEEMEKCHEQGLLDRCNHICNFEIKDKQWETTANFYTDYDRDAFGSLDYPFSEVIVFCMIVD
ncbi:hypothetical protein NQ314_017397 [Rhamnusium bicolor]|uniref:Uncharacterized protein n=1 Tax=Rhamnusium bicolor TaxID=1586634 RepID=A0AAV8WSY8_9CUCU|nr:hypothetical protein NQ314_017397 [Rhamnusium bicolor]